MKTFLQVIGVLFLLLLAFTFVPAVLVLIVLIALAGYLIFRAHAKKKSNSNGPQPTADNSNSSPTSDSSHKNKLPDGIAPWETTVHPSSSAAEEVSPSKVVAPKNEAPAKPYQFKQTSGPTIHKLRKKLYDFVVFDIETSGLSRANDEIIQLSALKLRGDKIVDKFDYYVKPRVDISETITYLTGITMDMLKDSPDIETVMPKFVDFVEDFPLVGHNIVHFDIPFILNNGFSLDDISLVDTYLLSERKQFTSPIEDHKLPTLKKYYGITNHSHNALDDCETNAIVYQNLRDDKLDAVEVDTSGIPKNFAGLRFAISGEFLENDRDSIIDLIQLHGGRVTSTVSGATDFLLDGKQISTRLVDGEHSSKELKAQEQQANGGKVKIIDYPEFTSLLNSAV